MASFGTGVTTTSANIDGAHPAGEAITAGDLVYLTGGKWKQAQSNASTTIGAVGAVNGTLGVALNSALAVNAPVDVVLTGLLENCSGLLPGQAYCVSDTAAGDFVVHSGLTEDADYVAFMGIGVSTTSLYLAPINSGVISNLV